MEITLVGMYADTSPAWVSITGKAVREPFPAASPILAARSEAAVKVKHISRVGLTSRRTTKKQRHLTVCHGLLGKIVVENHNVLAVVTEVLAHSAASVGSQEL